jgi:hypothetical protein
MSEYFLETSSDNDCHTRPVYENEKHTLSILSETQNEGVADEDKDIRFMILESHQLGHIRKEKCENDSSGMDELHDLYCEDPFTFYVLLNPVFVNEKRADVIRKIIENEKPAHTVGEVILLRPWICLGMHSYIGINTVLDDGSFTVGNASIGGSTTMVTVSDAIRDKRKNSVTVSTLPTYQEGNC